MKAILFLVFSLGIIQTSMSQLTTKAKCPDLEVDLLDGKINFTVRPNIPDDRLKLLLPCFTSTTTVKDSARCGTTVFYKDKDIYFYTDRDYIEIGPKFKGKLSLPLMGAHRNNLFQWLGNPKIKDDKWSAFQTNYGIMVLYFDAANKVNKIQISTNTAETVKLCQ